MLKLVTMLAAVALLMGATEGGLLPGRHSSSVWYLTYNFRKTADACFGPGFDRQTELDLRRMYVTCYAQLHGEKEESNFLREKRSVRGIADFFHGNDIMSSFSMPSKSPKSAGSPFYSANVVRTLMADVLGAQRLLSCVFGQMGLAVDASGNIDDSVFTAKYANDASIPEDVKGFLLDGISGCKKSAGGVNDMIWGQKYQNFFKTLNFWRCADYNKPYACMKADLQKDAAEFDLSGLDGEFADLDDNAKRYIIASSYPNWEQTGLYDA